MIKVPCPAIVDCRKTGVFCRKDCDGTKEESEAPECHFSEMNGRDIIAIAFCPSYDSKGIIQAKELPYVQQQLLKAINNETIRKPFIRPPKLIHKFFDGGNSDEEILERLYKIRLLVTYAQDKKLDIKWG
jgi:hypothetical protein